MDLHVLKMFRAVAVEGGVARAAESLHCVQSNVSARLAQLEEHLGTLLFQRQGRKMVITPAGTKLLCYAERLLELAEEARDAVRAEKAPADMLRVGTIKMAAATQLPPLLARFHGAHPAVGVDVKIGASEQIVKDVLTCKADIGIVAGPAPHPALESEVLSDIKMVLVTSLSRGHIDSLDDIADDTMIVLKQDCPSRVLLDAWLAGRAAAPLKTIEVDYVDAMLSLVAVGQGIAVMPLSMLVRRGADSSVKWQPLPGQCADFSISIVWRKDGLFYPARQAFVTAMKACPATVPLRGRDHLWPVARHDAGAHADESPAIACAHDGRDGALDRGLGQVRALQA